MTGEGTDFTLNDACAPSVAGRLWASVRRVLKLISPWAFNDGLARANNLGRSMVEPRVVDRFLDAGCGDGSLTMSFARASGARVVHGIDFVDEYGRLATGKGILFKQQDLNERWSFENSFFDLILSSQSIEHLHNTRRFAEELHRCLKPGGQAIILTENLASWVNIGALVLGWQPFSMTCVNCWSVGNPMTWHIDEEKDLDLCQKLYDGGHSGAIGHTRVLSFVGLRNILEKAGFKEIDIRTRGYLPLGGLLSDLLCTIDRRHGHFLVASARKQA